MPAAPPYHTTLPHLTKDNWRDEASKKRDQLAALVPAEWRLAPEALEAAGDDVRGVAASSGILSERELEITELDEVEEVRPRSASPPPSSSDRVELTLARSCTLQLANRITKGTYTAVEVTTAFSKRAAIAQQLTNCASSLPLLLLRRPLRRVKLTFLLRHTGLTEIFFDDALEQAKQLDEVLKSTGKPVGPLRASFFLPVAHTERSFCSRSGVVPITHCLRERTRLTCCAPFSRRRRPCLAQGPVRYRRQGAHDGCLSPSLDLSSLYRRRRQS